MTMNTTITITSYLNSENCSISHFMWQPPSLLLCDSCAFGKNIEKRFRQSKRLVYIGGRDMMSLNFWVCFFAPYQINVCRFSVWLLIVTTVVAVLLLLALGSVSTWNNISYFPPKKSICGCHWKFNMEYPFGGSHQQLQCGFCFR